jgi:twitching motility protein PilT
VELFTPVLSKQRREQFDRDGDLDWSAPLGELVGPSHDGRIRVNLHRQRGDWAAAIRFIAARPPRLESLNLPDVVGDWIGLPRGLVLVTGPTGAGKSTTLAAMIQRANELYNLHVITLEDPIEYEFEHGTCLIEQRQIGDDSPSFAAALRHVVRQRPDLILVGEMRDRETIAAALTAAETGHLVLATLHTSSAPATLARIIDVFDQERQGQTRLQLAASLRCIVCQSLLPDRAGGGVVPATEVLIANTAIRRAIRDGQEHQIDGMLETGQQVGMHSLEQDLARLVGAGRISYDDAVACCSDMDKLQRRMGSSSPTGMVR